MGWSGDAAQSFRLRSAISGFVGANGSGKSLVCAFDTMGELAAGGPVPSSMRCLVWVNPRPCDDPAWGCDKSLETRHKAAHPCYLPWTDWDQFMDMSFGVVVADEIMGVASATDRSDLPQRVMKRMQKMRHFDIRFRWTGPAWARADKTLSEITQSVTVCLGDKKVPAEDQRRAWRQARRIVADSYDVQEMVDFREQSRARQGLVGRQKLWVPKCNARLAYDTFDRVFEVGASDLGGRCDDCGKRIRQEYCKCHREDADTGTDADASPSERRDRTGDGSVEADQLLSADEAAQLGRRFDPDDLDQTMILPALAGVIDMAAHR